MISSRRVLVIGLDCAEPSLVFDRWRQDLPTLNRLMKQGAWGNWKVAIHQSLFLPGHQCSQAAILGNSDTTDSVTEPTTVTTI